MAPSRCGASLSGNIDGGGSIRPADDADRCGFAQREIHDAERCQTKRTEQRGKNTELSGRSQQQRLWIGEQRTEVRHRSHAHEYDEWKGAGFDTHHIGQVQQTIAGSDFHTRYVAQDATESDGHQQQRLELAHYGEIQQQQADQNHDELAKGQLIETGSLPDLFDQFHEVLVSRAGQPIETSGAPTATASPSLTWISLMVPPQGALISVSIFMASTIRSG